jgi:hypothetical protein
VADVVTAEELTLDTSALLIRCKELEREALRAGPVARQGDEVLSAALVGISTVRARKPAGKDRSADRRR